MPSRSFLSGEIVGTVTGKPPPAPLTGVGVKAALHIGTGGQMDPQVLPPLGTAEGEQIVPRSQESEIDLLAAQQAVGSLMAAGMTYQPHPAPRAAGAAQHPQGAQGIPLGEAQVLLRLIVVPQAEGDSSSQPAGYWFILALTRYSPPVTPPNRYLPSELVLVVAISSSRPAVTWKRPTKQPATALPFWSRMMPLTVPL